MSGIKRKTVVATSQGWPQSRSTGPQFNVAEMQDVMMTIDCQNFDSPGTRARMSSIVVGHSGASELSGQWGLSGLSGQWVLSGLSGQSDQSGLPGLSGLSGPSGLSGEPHRFSDEWRS